MQQLHLVGFTTDLEGLIFSARKGSKSGSFVISLDDGLLSTIEDAQRLRSGEPETADDGDESRSRALGRRPRPESTLSPREIQSRLRSGSTIAEVARAAGVDEEWVGRFAVPILAEQQQVIDRARHVTFSKARLGDSAYALGASVLWNLADRGLRMTERAYEASWRAWNHHGAVWIVQFMYVSRQRSQAAEWEVDLREGTLHSRNRLAADLGYVEPGRRRRATPTFEAPERETSLPAAEGRASKQAASTRKAASARKTAPRPSAPKKSASKKPAAGAAAAKKAPAQRVTVARKAAAAKKALGKKAAAAKKAAAGKKRAPAARTKAKQARPATRPTKRTAKTSKAGATTVTAARRRAAPARKPTPAKRAGSARAASASAPAQTTAGRGRASTGGGQRTGGRTPAVPPPSTPRVADERVSHLARPVVPPTRRGAARDGTPAPANGGGAQTSVARQARPGSESSTPLRAERPAASRPVPSSPRESLRPAAVEYDDSHPRIERVRGRPAATATASTSASASASTRPEPSRGEERPPARPRPVVPPPPVAAAAGRGEVAIKGDDASVVIRRAPQAAARPPTQSESGRGPAPRSGPDARPTPTPRPARQARPPTQSAAPTQEEGEGESARGDRLSRRLGRRSPASTRSGRDDGNEPQPQPASPAAAPPSDDNAPRPRRQDEPVWHGPGSGDPAPPVRIRADLAAAASARSADADARRGRRSAPRDRPLRAR